MWSLSGKVSFLKWSRLVELLCPLCGFVIGRACRFWLAAFIVSVSGGILSVVARDFQKV